MGTEDAHTLMLHTMSCWAGLKEDWDRESVMAWNDNGMYST